MSLAVVYHLLRERLSYALPAREPEPELVMQSAQQTAAFAEAGEATGALAFLYLYNALHISALLRPGDRVLDLACGPARQLAQVASLNPEVQFVGLDASTSMLEHAQARLAAGALGNVELQQGDMGQLGDWPAASLDVVTCTMSLHHLPDVAALQATLAGLRRLLKPQGRIYLVDFGRLKRRSSQRFFAQDLQQSPQFTQDYFNSLRAAFSVAELSAAAALLDADLQRHVTVLAPFLVVLRSAQRRALGPVALQRARAVYTGLSAQQQANFRGLADWMRHSGLELPCDLK